MCKYYSYLVGIEEEKRSDTRLDPLLTRIFQLRLIHHLTEGGNRSPKILRYRKILRRNLRKLTKKEIFTLKAIFCEFFRNKDPYRDLRSSSQAK